MKIRLADIDVSGRKGGLFDRSNYVNCDQLVSWIRKSALINEDPIVIQTLQHQANFLEELFTKF